MARTVPLLLSLPILLCACATTVGTGSRATVPEDAVEQCAAQCESLGLEVDALSLGKRDVSCICEPDD